MTAEVIKNLPKNQPILTFVEDKHVDGLGIYSCYSLLYIQNFPEKVKEIGIKRCPKLVGLPSFPLGLTELHLTNINIKYIPSLPASLRKLMIDFTEIQRLPNLPSQLKFLCVFDTPLLTLPDLPPSLIYLDLDNCYKLQLPLSFSHITHLNEFVLSGGFINELPELPESLEVLEIRKSQIRQIKKLPNQLKRLKLVQTPFLDYLPEILPQTMMSLCCLATSIVYIPELPSTCEKFEFHQNPFDEIYDLYHEKCSCSFIGEINDVMVMAHKKRIPVLKQKLNKVLLYHKDSIIKEQQKQRCLHIKEELMAKTWNPSRYLDWCTDIEEQKEWASFQEA